MSNYFSLLIGAVVGLAVFVATVINMRRKKKRNLESKGASA